MNQENYPLSDLDSYLPQTISQKTIFYSFQNYPELILEEPRTPSNRTSITHELENFSITPTDKPTIALNDRPRKRKSTIPPKQLFRKQRKSEEAALDYNFTKNPQFQFNLTYKIEENINQWRIVL